MFSINTLLDLNQRFFVAQITTVDYVCAVGGVCKETVKIFDSFNQAIETLLIYFFTDPDSVYEYIFGFCQVIAGIGALWFLTPLMLDSVKHNYGIDINKILLLFILMLMFANQGNLGKSLAYGNYAFIQGVHQGIQKKLDSSEMLNKITEDFALDQQLALKIATDMLICNQLILTKVDDSGKSVDNQAFKNCYANLKTMIESNTFRNPSTDVAFKKAALNTDFTKMGTAIKNEALGFAGVADTALSDKEQDSIRNLLVGWRAAIAIVPDLALIGALLFYPFPLAISFINTSFLQAWFTGMWSVGLFKFIMTIFTSTFVIIQAKLAGQMPQNTVELVLGIAAPSIAIALATGSGLGLSGLVSQGVSTVSAKLTNTQMSTNDAVRNGTPPPSKAQ